jgi:hypothetical protein
MRGGHHLRQHPPHHLLLAAHRSLVLLSLGVSHTTDQIKDERYRRIQRTRYFSHVTQPLQIVNLGLHRCHERMTRVKRISWGIFRRFSERIEHNRGP